MLNQDPRRDLADDLGGLVFWFICKFLRKDVSPNFLGIPLDTFDRGRPGDFFSLGSYELLKPPTKKNLVEPEKFRSTFLFAEFLLHSEIIQHSWLENGGPGLSRCISY